MADEAIEKTPSNTGMTRPSFIKTGDQRGTEHIGKEDLQIPRLALAQGLTPQVAEQKEGFATGVMFNSQSEQIYGKGPLKFIVLRGDKPRYIQFRPREEGGGVIDMNVPAGDPRTRFGTDPETGKSIKPLATKFYDFIIALLPIDPVDPMKSIISLSFKSSGLKIAREFNTLIRYRNTPIFAGIYSVSSIVQKNAQGIFNNFEVKNAGWIEDEEMYKKMEELWMSLADRTVVVDRTGQDTDIDDHSTDFPHVD